MLFDCFRNTNLDLKYDEDKKIQNLLLILKDIL
jgi:hypothetical protein